MKNSILAVATGIIFSLATNNVAQAQTVSFKKALKDTSEITLNAVLDNSKGGIKLNQAANSKGESASAPAVNEKAKKDFSKKFSKVSNEYWEVIEEGFSASFDAGKIHNIVFYDKKGNWNGYLKSYDEDNLPYDVRNAVLGEYNGATINRAHEILTPSSNGTPTYLIQLQTKKHLLEVRYNEGNIDTWKMYDRQQ